jgi:hypothetical protein
MLWNLSMYVLVALDAARSLVGRASRVRAGALATGRPAVQASGRPLGGFQRGAGRGARTSSAWSGSAPARLRAPCGCSMCAAGGIGLIAGLYLRGCADYRAGWESTFLDAGQVRALVGVLYGPASALTGIAIPDPERLAALRFEGDRGGESAARWIHLLAATTVLFVVLPRLLLALGATFSLWRRSRTASLAPGLVPYFRWAFGSGPGVAGRGIVAVMPCAYEARRQRPRLLRRLRPMPWARASRWTSMRACATATRMACCSTSAIAAAARTSSSFCSASRPPRRMRTTAR